MGETQVQENIAASVIVLLQYFRRASCNVYLRGNNEIKSSTMLDDEKGILRCSVLHVNVLTLILNQSRIGVMLKNGDNDHNRKPSCQSV